MEKGGTILPSPSNIKGFVGGAANPVDLQIGPDGISTTSTSAAARSAASSTRPASTSRRVAVAKANPTSGIGMTVSFDGSASSDPNGDPLTYAWDLDGDGAFDDSTTVNPTWTYNAAGTFASRCG